MTKEDFLNKWIDALPLNSKDSDRKEMEYDLQQLQNNKIEKLKHAFEETIWMAIRYAHGRHTYAPSSVRYAIKNFQMVFPDWKPKQDITIEPPNKEDLGGINFESDHLHDIF